MTFEEGFAAIGKGFDNIINWHLGLPWYFLVPLLLLYLYVFLYVYYMMDVK